MILVVVLCACVVYSIENCPLTGQTLTTAMNEWTICHCPPDFQEGNVWGTEYYFTDDSNVCTAAKHEGNLGENGGCIYLRKEHGRSFYPAGNKNGVQTLEYGPWGTSIKMTNANCPNNEAIYECPHNAQEMTNSWTTCYCTSPYEPNGNDNVWGSDNVFDVDSYICSAAYYEGVIASNGGCVKVRQIGERNGFSSGYNNGIQTLSTPSTNTAFELGDVGSCSVIVSTIKCPENTYDYRDEVAESGYPQNFHCYCDPEVANYGYLLGRNDPPTWYYTDDSTVCRAGAHAGLFNPNNGGCMKVTVVEGKNNYDNTYGSYGIVSDVWNDYWGGSFAVHPSDSCERYELIDDGDYVDKMYIQCDYMEGFILNQDQTGCVRCTNGIAQSNGVCRTYAGIDSYTDGKLANMQIEGIDVKVRWNPQCYVFKNPNVYMEIMTELTDLETDDANLELRALEHFKEGGWKHGYDMYGDCEFPDQTAFQMLTMGFITDPFYRYAPENMDEYVGLMGDIMYNHGYRKDKKKKKRRRSIIDDDDDDWSVTAELSVFCSYDTLGTGPTGFLGCQRAGLYCDVVPVTVYNSMIDYFKEDVLETNGPVGDTLTLIELFDSFDVDCGMRDEMSCGFRIPISGFAAYHFFCVATIGFGGFEVDLPSLECSLPGVTGFPEGWEDDCGDEWTEFFSDTADVLYDMVVLGEAAAGCKVSSCWDLVRDKTTEYLSVVGTTLDDYLATPLEEFFVDLGGDIGEFFTETIPGVGVDVAHFAERATVGVFDDAGDLVGEISDWGGNVVQEDGESVLDFIWENGADVLYQIGEDVVGDVSDEVEDIVDEIFGNS